MGRDKVPLYAQIREDHRRLGLGVRALARKHGVHRRMVREALTSQAPAPRKVPVRKSPVLGAVAELIDGMLREDLNAPRKQRHTSRRIWQRLRDEHHEAVLNRPGFCGGSQSTGEWDDGSSTEVSGRAA